MFFLLYSAHLTRVREKVGVSRKNHIFPPSTVASLPVNEHRLDFFKLKTHLHKTAPDMSTLNGGIGKYSPCTAGFLPGLPLGCQPHITERRMTLCTVCCMGPFMAVSLATDSMYDQLRSSGTELVLIHSL